MSPVGRTPDVGIARDVVICVRLAGPEAADVEWARGGMSRSEFVRQAVAAQVRLQRDLTDE